MRSCGGNHHPDVSGKPQWLFASVAENKKPAGRCRRAGSLRRRMEMRRLIVVIVIIRLLHGSCGRCRGGGVLLYGWSGRFHGHRHLLFHDDGFLYDDRSIHVDLLLHGHWSINWHWTVHIHGFLNHRWRWCDGGISLNYRRCAGRGCCRCCGCWSRLSLHDDTTDDHLAADVAVVNGDGNARFDQFCRHRSAGFVHISDGSAEAISDGRAAGLR